MVATPASAADKGRGAVRTRRQVSDGRRGGKTCGVSVHLNHTIVSCRDQQRSAAFLSGILGLPPATRFGHFLVVAADNDVSLDFAGSYPGDEQDPASGTGGVTFPA